MDFLFQSDVASWHPLVANLPLGVLVAGCIAVLFWIFTGRAFWRRSVFYLLCVGLVTMILGYLVSSAPGQATAGTPATALVFYHARYAFWGLIGMTVTLLLLSVAVFWLERRLTLDRKAADPAFIRWGIGLLVFVTTILVTLSSLAGSLMLKG